MFESVKFSPSQYFVFVLQISLNVSLSRACFAWQRSFLMFSFNICGKLTRGCAKLNHLRMLYVWPLSCHMQSSRKIKTIPDSHIILNAQSGLKYRTVVVVSVVTFFFCFGFHSNYFRWQDSYYLIFCCFIVFILGLPRRLLCRENRFII